MENLNKTDDKISNEEAYSIVFLSGLILNPEKEYEDPKMRMLAIRHRNARMALHQIRKEIKELGYK